MNIKTFEDLRSHVWEQKNSTMEILVDRLEDLDAFHRGMYRGEILAYDEILSLLRNVLKYGCGDE